MELKDVKKYFDEYEEDCGLKVTHIKWLLEQAGKLEEIKKYFYAEDKDVVECFRLMIQVFEDKEAPKRNKRQ